MDLNLAAIEGESDPDAAFDRFTEFTAATNQMVQKDPKLIGKLNGQIRKLKNGARNLAKKVGAESFTISAGFPAGVSVGFTFPIS